MLFEYHCSQCEHEFEKLVFNSSEKIACPECKSKKVTRMMSAFAFSSGGKFKSTASSSCGGCAATSCSTCGLNEFLSEIREMPSQFHFLP
jgi:putative FmdB family regulatory protein